MTTNSLSKRQRETAEVGGAKLFQVGLGFGMGVAVVLDPRMAESTICGAVRVSASAPTRQSLNFRRWDRSRPAELAAHRQIIGRQGDIMSVKRMDNVGIVVEDLDAAIEFFTELGLELEGRAPIEGDWADGVTGLRDMRVEIAMMRTPDGHSRLEISRFLAPPVVADHRKAPVNALGYLRVMFTVEDIDDTLARLGKCGAELVGEVAQYQDTYRLCYIRGPEGILIGLAQELGEKSR
jgi:catechol 2,3-dioxygenase-like lactoylglutathione lyase family enzyme